MRLALTHRRLAVLMGLTSLLAFAAGAGVEPLPTLLATVGLLVSLFWQPSPGLSSRLEKVWLFLALLLALRALLHIFVIRGDVVIPVVDLLFLLLVAEALRSLDAPNDTRLYALSFALLLAATAYRPGLLFALAFVAYIGLATVGLMVGHLKRQCGRHGVRDVRIPPSFLATTAALSGVTLLFSAVVFLTFPRVSRSWAGRGRPAATSIAGFADRVTLGSHGARIYGNPQIVLRVEFPDGRPPDPGTLYWRGRSYDRFDGVRWSRSRRIPPSFTPERWFGEWEGERVTQEIYGSPLDNRVLFALHPLVEVEAESRIQPVFDNTGDYSYWGSATPAYTAYSILGRPAPRRLREAERGFIPAGDHYLDLPELPSEVLVLADSLLAGLPTAYDKAVALERWFRSEFGYTLELPATAREATLEHFLLRRRQGHCEYFSTAMAILLRTHGIPTREVNGFLGGEWSDFGDYLAVTQNQAHAWVEVWFPGVGWVPFDPTPAGGGASEALGSWSWPGRFVFDAVQHRWNKWVLDYSFQTQFGLLQRGEALLRRAPSQDGGSEADEETPGLTGQTLPWVGGVAALVLAWMLLRARRTRKPLETRLYLQLRGTARKAGAPTRAVHSPSSLIRYLEERGHSGTSAARSVVRTYLHARFSGESLEPARRQAMVAAFKRAAGFLRREPLTPS